MSRVSIIAGLTLVDGTSYGGWDGYCPGCDRDAVWAMNLALNRVHDGVSVLLNRCATKLAVRDLYLDSVKRLRSDDLLFLYYSGHGGQQPDENGDEQDGKDETLCLYDGEAVDDTLAEFFSMTPAGLRVFFVTDTCNSGTNYRGRGTPEPLPTPISVERAVPDDFRGQLIHFGGCEDGRSSFGGPDGGVFTLALAKAIAANPAITYSEWWDAACVEMPRDQVPSYSEYGNVTDEFRKVTALL